MDIKDLKILLVEDDLYMRSLIKATLQQINSVAILEAVDGKDGLEKFYNNNTREEELIDLILCDLVMPNMDGFEFIKEVRKERSIPIIVLTGNAEQDNLKKAVELGINGFVTKPVSYTALERQIQKAMTSPFIDPSIFE